MKGKGFSIRMWKCEKGIANNLKKLKSIVNEIIDLIEMRAISDFLVGKGKPDMAGFSIIKMIETSHVALHSFIINDTFMLSIESCKDFDDKKLKKYVLQRFKPTGYNTTPYSVVIPVKVTK